MNDRPTENAERYLGRLMLGAILSGSPLCLDSGPLIDYIARNEPVTALLAPLMRDPRVPVVLSVVTLTEVVTRAASDGDGVRVEAIHRALLGTPGLRIVDLDQDHALATARVRAETGLKLPDAAIVATARLAGAGALLGNDRQWRGRPLGVPYHHLDDILALT